MKRTGRATFVEASMVPAPECDACGTKMRPASVTEWKCSNPACSEKDKPKHTGVYPVTPNQD